MGVFYPYSQNAIWDGNYQKTLIYDINDWLILGFTQMY